MSDFEWLKEELPSKETFYSSITDRKLLIKNMNMLKFDVLLLDDMFEKFRNNSLKNYGLCPSYYLSAPGLS